ncbi:hypothetical protein GLAREA_03531 [Glarea lozoyensis ATCC 20868]|uniref:Uncharacterized protein n=1 Tax=Glarea lozoyensis (strain ATCC 20868 / MF5171) TaxID=1116229 RepID=S3D077_GLAL2|nr:uncharacterized protein GLAREA_03531 [Glarea lozoyensis ATCC 20868]EPE30564.1 hypothetical protein GLAREA_03531 [Glarea lozoyensis ATCC 20868]
MCVEGRAVAAKFQPTQSLCLHEVHVTWSRSYEVDQPWGRVSIHVVISNGSRNGSSVSSLMLLRTPEVGHHRSVMDRRRRGL